jgi:SAM-dependent methyltransferase
LSLFFRAAYLVGFKPWDSGIPPPELIEFVEGGRHPPGKALDLGCGTGTNCIYLARHRWEATGVDFVPRAIDTARKKAMSSRTSAWFVVGDVRRLGELGLGSGYQLLLDMGCFHSIADDGRDAYVHGATSAAAPDATMLLSCLVRGEKTPRFGPRGVGRGEIQHRFAAGWDMTAQQEGRPMLGFGTAWNRLEKR